MVGKRVQFDNAAWEAVKAVMQDTGKAFQQLRVLKKQEQPVGISLKEPYWIV